MIINNNFSNYPRLSLKSKEEATATIIYNNALNPFVFSNTNIAPADKNFLSSNI